jgi:hypothetical protein
VLRLARGMRTEEGEDIEWGERMEEEKRRWEGNCFCTIVDAVTMGWRERWERERIRKMGWVSELKGLNLELRVQIHLQLYPTIQRQLEWIF